MHYERDHYVALRREFLWRFSKPRWALQEGDLRWAEEHVGVLAKQSAERIQQSLRYVWPEFVENVRFLAERFSQLRSFSESIEFFSAIHERTSAAAEQAQTELLEAMTRAALPFVALKGAAMRAYEGSGSGGNDLDVLVSDLDAAWRAVDVAESRGYSLERIKVGFLSTAQTRFASDASPPRIWANGNMFKSESPARPITQGDWDLGRVRTLDLHVTAFPIAGECLLLAPIRERSRVAEVGDLAFRVPSVEDMVLIEIAHLAHHGTLTIRGISRIARLLASSRGLDHDYVADRIAHNRLSIVANAALLAVESEFEPAREQAAALRAATGAQRSPLAVLSRRVAEARRVEKYGVLSPWSLAALLIYLADAGRAQLGPAQGVRTAFEGLGRALSNYPVNPRAHPRWRERRLGWLSPRQRGVMLQRLDDVRLSALPARSDPVTGDTEWLGNEALIANKGRDDEVIVTLVGAFASAPYAGSVSPKVRQRCLEVAAVARRSLEQRDAAVTA